MRSDRQALSTVSDALGLGAATVDIASKGIESAISVASNIKSKLVAARSPGVDRTKIQAEIKQLQASLSDTVNGATFSGQNWLTSDGTATNTTRTLVSSFSRDAAGDISIGTISVDIGASTDDGAGNVTSGTMLVDTNGDTGILDKARTATAGGDFSVLELDIASLADDDDGLARLESFISGVDDAINEMTNSATNLGAVKSRVNLQKDFADSLMDAIDTGIGTLVDADMNEESTRLQALQVRQQLGIQALSLANQSSQSILSLFR
jgi:flagellin